MSFRSQSVRVLSFRSTREKQSPAVLLRPLGAGTEGAALHGGRDVVAGEVEERGRDVQEMRALHFAARIEAGCVEDEGGGLCVVAGVGAGAVLLDVEAAVAHAADGTPVESAEVNDEIGSDVAHVAIDLLGLEDEGVERATLGIGKGFEAEFHLVAEGLVFRGGYYAARLAALDVEENTGVVTDLAH